MHTQIQHILDRHRMRHEEVAMDLELCLVDLKGGDETRNDLKKNTQKKKQIGDDGSTWMIRSPVAR